MSRVGNKPIPLPKGVKLTIGKELLVEGPKGKHQLVGVCAIDPPSVHQNVRSVLEPLIRERLGSGHTHAERRVRTHSHLLARRLVRHRQLRHCQDGGGTDH